MRSNVHLKKNLEPLQTFLFPTLLAALVLSVLMIKIRLAMHLRNPPKIESTQSKNLADANFEEIIKLHHSDSCIIILTCTFLVQIFCISRLISVR